MIPAHAERKNQMEHQSSTNIVMGNNIVAQHNKAKSSTSFAELQNWCCGRSGKKYKKCHEK
jgi:hypothetical protein